MMLAMKGAFDPLFDAWGESDVDAFEAGLVPATQRLVLEGDVVWIARRDDDAWVRTLVTSDLDALPIWEHPRLGELEEAASAIDWGEGDYEVRNLELVRFWNVEETVTDSTKQIGLSKALELDPESTVGDELGVPDPERSVALRRELIAALRRRRPIAMMEESSVAARVVELLDRIAATTNRSQADLATELVAEELVSRWPLGPTRDMPDHVRTAVVKFCESCMYHLEALGDDAFEAFLPPDLSVVRALFGWLERHRRRDHFRGRRR